MTKISAILLMCLNLIFFSCKKQTVNSSEIERRIKNKYKIEYSEKTIKGNLDLFDTGKKVYINANVKSSIVSSPIFFIKCTFEDTVRAIYQIGKNTIISDFEQPVIFMGCKFKKPVFFSQSTFRKNAVFLKCEFMDDAHFESCNFEDETSDFRESVFNSNSKFQNCNFKGIAQFLKCQFNSNSIFDNCHFEKFTNFSVCQFKKYVSISHNVVNEVFRMNYSIFSDRAIIESNIFHGNTELYKIASKKYFSFKSNKIFSDFNIANSLLDSNLFFENNNFNGGQINAESVNLLNLKTKSINGNFTVDKKETQIFTDTKSN